jgi:hypothetical protein
MMNTQETRFPDCGDPNCPMCEDLRRTQRGQGELADRGVYWKLTAAFSDDSERWYVTETREEAVNQINRVFADLPRLREERHIRLVNLNLKEIELRQDEYRGIVITNAPWWH